MTDKLNTMIQTEWKCLSCGETRNITMIPVRLSEYSTDWDPEIQGEDILIYRPKYSLTTKILEPTKKGECYCSYRCFTNPKKLRSKL